MEKYNLSCELNVEQDYDEESKSLEYNFFLYTDDYTVRLHFSNQNWIGYYSGTVYYYDIERNNVDYEEDIKPLTSFLNDFSAYVAYDTKSREDSFDILYETAKNSDNGWGHDIIHFDNWIGYVDYIVDLTYEAGYYYMANRDTSITKECYKFKFSGLLTPI